MTWKDFRSGMACHLLRSGWSFVEVNARLGHTPNSTALNAYVNYLALDGQRSKERLKEYSIGQLRRTLEESRRRERLLDTRIQRQEDQNRVMAAVLSETRAELLRLRSHLSPLLEMTAEKKQA